MAYKFQGGSSQVWKNYNRVLPFGVVGVETDTAKYKVGTGARWNDAGYAGGDVYPQFRIDGTNLQLKTGSSASWNTVDSVTGKPGVDGNNDGSAESVFYYTLANGTYVEDEEPDPEPSAGATEVFATAPLQVNVTNPATGYERLDTVRPNPATGSANATLNFSDTVVGVNVANNHSATLTLTVNGDAFVVDAGDTITVKKYAGFTSCTIAATGPWAAVGFAEFAGVL